MIDFVIFAVAAIGALGVGGWAATELASRVKVKPRRPARNPSRDETLGDVVADLVGRSRAERHAARIHDPDDPVRIERR